jgi:hypothetical protein
MVNRRVRLIGLPLLGLLFLASPAFAQIDLFEYARQVLDNEYRHAPRPWERTRQYDRGWNITPAPVSVQYEAIGDPPTERIVVPNTSRSFTNGTANPGSFPYEAVCSGTVQHVWRVTYGMAGDLVAGFNALPGIDSASPTTGPLNLTQGLRVVQEAPYSQPVSAVVSVPAMSSATYQTYFDVRPLTRRFVVRVKIGGSFRFEAFRGNTRSQTVIQLGRFFRTHPHDHVEVVDDQFVIVRLEGEYQGALGRSPGNFTCEVLAAQ